jgi:hypothetical protein
LSANSGVSTLLWERPWSRGRRGRRMCIACSATFASKLVPTDCKAGAARAALRFVGASRAALRLLAKRPVVQRSTAQCSTTTLQLTLNFPTNAFK